MGSIVYAAGWLDMSMLVDPLVQTDLFEQYNRSPLVTANDVLTLAKKRTGVG